MRNFFKWLNLQLFAEGGGEGGGEAGTTGVTSPDAGEARLRELGVPDSVLSKRAKRAKPTAAAPIPATEQAPAAEANTAPTQQAAAAAEGSTPVEANADDKSSKRMSWDEIMSDPEYNQKMQATIQSRLKASKAAEETMSKLSPAIEMLSKHYGLDAEKLNPEELVKAISEDDLYYEDKALELGVPVETAKKIDQLERESARRQAEEEKTIEQQRIQQHLSSLVQQGEALKQTFPSFDLRTELNNPLFARMTSPSGGVSVEDAYYAVHRKEIMSASLQAATQNTAVSMANAIRSGQARPVESGTSAQAPSVTTFDYAHASKEQRDALKRRIAEAAARGQKLYPGK